MLSRKRTDQHSLLCVDIGTQSVKACVFVEDEGHLELKGYAVVNQPPQVIQGGAIVQLVEVIRHTQEAVKKAENMARITARDVVFGLSGELVKGMTLQLTHTRNHAEKRIDAQELKSIIYKLQWEAFDQIRKQIADEMSLSEIELKLVNASIVSMKVDGELVEDPRGMSGEEVCMEIFNCFSPLQHFGHIQSIAVELPFHQLKGVFIQSFAVAHSLALKNALESAVIIDVGAGTTDVCVLHDGSIVGNRSFSLAGNTLTKRISYELSTSFDEAESVKQGYSSGTLEKRSHQVVAEAIAADVDIWVSSLDFCLKELPLKKLPHQFLLCGQSSALGEFAEALKRHEWDQHFPVDAPAQVRQLDFGDILKGSFDADDFEPEYLPLIAVANTSYDLLYSNTSVESILSTIIADRGV